MGSIFRFFLSLIFYCTTSTILLVSQTWGICIDPPANLVSWWTGNNNPLDFIGLNHGNLTNGLTFNMSGKVAQAFDFDGTEDALVMSATALNGDYTALTIDAWAYPRTHGNAGTEDLGLTIISKTESDGFALRIYNGYIQADLRTTVEKL